MHFLHPDIPRFAFRGGGLRDVQFQVPHPCLSYTVRIHYTRDQELRAQRTEALRRNRLEGRYSTGTCCKVAKAPDRIKRDQPAQ